MTKSEKKMGVMRWKFRSWPERPTPSPGPKERKRYFVHVRQTSTSVQTFNAAFATAKARDQFVEQMTKKNDADNSHRASRASPHNEHRTELKFEFKEEAT